MYDIFGKFGAIRQIRVGNTPETKGTALVVYEDIFDAKNACDHLSGFNVCNRYLVVLYYQRNKVCYLLSVSFSLPILNKECGGILVYKMLGQYFSPVTATAIYCFPFVC